MNRLRFWWCFPSCDISIKPARHISRERQLTDWLPTTKLTKKPLPWCTTPLPWSEAERHVTKASLLTWETCTHFNLTGTKKLGTWVQAMGACDGDSKIIICNCWGFWPCLGKPSPKQWLHTMMIVVSRLWHCNGNTCRFMMHYSNTGQKSTPYHDSLNTAYSLVSVHFIHDNYWGNVRIAGKVHETTLNTVNSMA